MTSRWALARGSQLIARQTYGKLLQRSFATAVSPKASYEPTTVAGIKTASRDDGGPTTRLAIIARAGTRYEDLPGLTTGLEEYAFKNTEKRSALRIVRESELLGGQLTAYHTREALVLQANFLRDDLPYFAELLAEVISQTKYSTHEFHETVEPVIHMKQAKLGATELALDAAHSVAFHSGLGAALYPTPSTPIAPYVSENTIAAYASRVYNKGNIALVADGATGDGLSQWIHEFFKVVPDSSPGQIKSSVSKYYGGEQRAARDGKNAMVIAFPGTSLAETKAEHRVLVGLLGGQSTIKWSSGFTLLAKAAGTTPGLSIQSANYAYSDAGLLAIQISGPATAVGQAARESVKALESVVEGSISKESLVKAIAKAKFDLLSASETSGIGLVHAGANLIHGENPLKVVETVKALDSVTAEKLKEAAKALLNGRAAVAAVGDLHVLPFAEDIGLKV